MNIMNSLVTFATVVSVVTANEKSSVAKPVDKRQIPSYNGGIVQSVQPPQPTPAAAANNVPASYQPNYLPVCVVQPAPYGNSIYQPPYYNGPTESYVPQYQPQYYPATYPTSSQYPFVYQPVPQYPATYQPAPQYPVAYQPAPQQSPVPAATPYSYSYFAATGAANNANNNNTPLSSNKK